jgi:hypothetical protein
LEVGDSGGLAVDNGRRRRQLARTSITAGPQGLNHDKNLAGRTPRRGGVSLRRRWQIQEAAQAGNVKGPPRRFLRGREGWRGARNASVCWGRMGEFPKAYESLPASPEQALPAYALRSPQARAMATNADGRKAKTPALLSQGREGAGAGATMLIVVVLVPRRCVHQSRHNLASRWEFLRGRPHQDALGITSCAIHLGLPVGRKAVRRRPPSWEGDRQGGGSSRTRWRIGALGTPFTNTRNIRVPCYDHMTAPLARGCT